MRRTIVVVACLAGLVLAGCGGTEVKLTRDQMVSRVLVACKTARAATEHALRTTSGTDRVRFMAAYVAGQHVLVERLDGLNPPDEAKADFDRFRRDMSRRLELYEQVKAAGPSGFARVTAANQRERNAIFIRLDAVNHRYGLTGCV